jgi:hypothetical protein
MACNSSELQESLSRRAHSGLPLVSYMSFIRLTGFHARWDRPRLTSKSILQELMCRSLTSRHFRVSIQRTRSRRILQASWRITHRRQLVHYAPIRMLWETTRPWVCRNKRRQFSRPQMASLEVRRHIQTRQVSLLIYSIHVTARKSMCWRSRFKDAFERSF